METKVDQAGDAYERRLDWLERQMAELLELLYDLGSSRRPQLAAGKPDLRLVRGGAR